MSPLLDRVFETLDTTSRRLRFPQDREVIITDTVGFIRDLPEGLLGAFRTTLEELREADLLVHVVDASAVDVDIQISAVVKILQDLNLDMLRRTLVFNKCDRIPPATKRTCLCRRYQAIGVSALHPDTLRPLLDHLDRELARGPPFLKHAEPDDRRRACISVVTSSQSAARTCDVRQHRRLRPRKRVQRIAQALQAAMPEAKVELSHRSPGNCLVATILSAQCTDQRVNQVTPALFKPLQDAIGIGQSQTCPDVEADHPVDRILQDQSEEHRGLRPWITQRTIRPTVPERMDDLVTLPGVGRKTANVLLGQAFGQPAIVVDTHVKRVANRLDLTTSDDPVQIEQDLQQLLPSSQWTSVSQRLLLHGRYICLAGDRVRSVPIYDDCYAKEKLLNDSQHDRIWTKTRAVAGGGRYRRGAVRESSISRGRPADCPVPWPCSRRVSRKRCSSAARVGVSI